MLRINCPFCGMRDHDEFTYLEDAAPFSGVQNDTESNS